MVNLLGIGTSSLLSLQNALNTTGHNIANVNTDGYSRQRVELAALQAQPGPGGYYGTGVKVDSVARLYDQFLVNEVRNRVSSHSNYDSYYTLAARLDNILADTATGLTPALQRFFNALQDVANNPGAMPERQVLLGEANGLADRFHYLNDSFANLNQEINRRLEVLVGEVNSLAANIAELNDAIAGATAQSGGRPANDLLDTRDRLISELSGKVSVTAVTQSNGSVDLMIGNGQPLVVGTRAEQLRTIADLYDEGQLGIGYANGSGVTTDIGRFLKGGEIAGILDFREEVLQPASNQLGLVAVGLAATFNQQHRLGVDLNGQFGGDFFQPLEAAVAPHAHNSGTAVVAVSIDDAAALSGSDYLLRYDGAQYQLTRLSDKSVQTGGGPFVVDGLTIAPSGAPAAGDSFLIRPTGNAAALFAVAVTSSDGIAAAAPVRSSVAAVNNGSAQLTNLAVTDTAGLPLAGPITLTFNAEALGPGGPGFEVTGSVGGPLAYDPATESNGKDFVLGSIRFSVSGTPAAGDSLVITNNLDGHGDNRNALALAGLQAEKRLNGGLSSYQDAYGNMVAKVGIKTRQAEAGKLTESVLLQQATAARDSVSGVNLDEEAANLIRYQQAYQAAAQVIAVADELFQTLLNATRR